MHAKVAINMAILLTSLLFVFEMSFLPKYRVNYFLTFRRRLPVRGSGFAEIFSIFLGQWPIPL